MSLCLNFIHTLQIGLLSRNLSTEMHFYILQDVYGASLLAKGGVVHG